MRASPDTVQTELAGLIIIHKDQVLEHGTTRLILSSMIAFMSGALIHADIRV